MSLNESDALDHIDLEFKGYTFFGKKFLTQSKREKRRSGLKEETPETIVIIASLSLLKLKNDHDLMFVIKITYKDVIYLQLEYRDWGFGFLIWSSAYFSICTWISIFLMKAPRPREISGKHNPKQTLITLALTAIALILLIMFIGLPADLDEIIILLILGVLFLVPIAYFIVWEIKSVRSE